MPITIRHDVPGGMAALTGLLGGQGRQAITDRANAARRAEIAQQIQGQIRATKARAQAQATVSAASNRAAGQRQAAALKAQRSNTQQQIQARAKEQSLAADQYYKRAAMQAGLQGQLREEAYDREIQKMEEQAKQRAGERKLVYSEQGKRDQAEAAAAEDWANKSVQEGTISPEQHQQILLQAKARKEGVKEHWIPDDSKKFPEGPDGQPRGIGDTWTEDTGISYTRNEKGIPVKTGTYKDTEQYYRLEAEKARQKEIASAKAERQSSVLTLATKLIGTEQTPIQPGAKGRLYDAPDTPPVNYTLAGALLAAETAIPQVPGQQAPPQQGPPKQQQQVQQVPPPQAGQPGWNNSPGAENLIIYDSDLKVPQQVGYSMAYMRTALRRFGPNRNLWLKETRDAYDKARKIVSDFQASGTNLGR